MQLASDKKQTSCELHKTGLRNKKYDYFMDRRSDPYLDLIPFWGFGHDYYKSWNEKVILYYFLVTLIHGNENGMVGTTIGWLLCRDESTLSLECQWLKNMNKSKSQKRGFT